MDNEIGNITVTLKPAGASLQFEVGSFDELLAVLEQGKDALNKAYGFFREIDDSPGTLQVTDNETTTTESPSNQPATTKRRGRPAKNAQAPEPIAPPTVASPPITPPAASPAPAASGDGLAIPPFLDRSNPAAIVNQPTPVPAAPPPPAPPAPAAPPTGQLAGKVIAHIKGAAGPDGGKAWVDWLAGNGLVIATATFDEAIDCLRFIDDARLKPVADALGIAA